MNYLLRYIHGQTYHRRRGPVLGGIRKLLLASLCSFAPLSMTVTVQENKNRTNKTFQSFFFAKILYSSVLIHTSLFLNQGRRFWTFSLPPNASPNHNGECRTDVTRPPQQQDERLWLMSSFSVSLGTKQMQIIKRRSERPIMAKDRRSVGLVRRWLRCLL